ncbi:MAG: hypothetical protein NVSMB31_12890 [Vulcanimicrobiaceae bacterium]
MLHRLQAAVVIAVLAVPLAVHAQTSPSPAPSAAPATSPGSDEITIDATVHIDRIRYDTTPSKAHLRLSGNAGCTAPYTVRRINLPEHPRSGVTYRNVTIVLHGTASAVKSHNATPCPALNAAHH